jgi:energy-coupling factor transport system ATP-binding protein
MLEFLELTTFSRQNPMDLSGGEKQRLALGKILLRKPDVLLLDEPTKGLDAAFKKKLSELLYRLRQKGMTIVMVSHDLEFCAQNVTVCGLLFDGCIISTAKTREFFEGNSFYTTSAVRMTAGILPGCVTADDITAKIYELQKNSD